MMVLFVTSNTGKLSEAQAHLQPIEVEQLKLDLDEPRGSLEEIAMAKALQAYREVGKALFVEDSGFFIESLGGFPGAYSAHVLKHLSLSDVVALIDKKEKEGATRAAYFKAVVAYIDDSGIRLFKGRVDGFVAKDVRGEGGFGYDPIFIPKGYEETFAENEGLKRNMSHRYRALIALKSFMLKESPS